MHCPICNDLLLQKDVVFMCPKGHGTLIAGGLLGELKRLNISDEIPAEPLQSDTDKQLTCPHCSSQMQKVNYNDTGITIDACTNCPYRWLDAGEIDKIEHYKPKIHPKDLLFLDDLHRKTKAIAAEVQENPNPDLPSNSPMYGFTFSPYQWIVSRGLFGLVSGMFKSKLVRIIAPFIILALIILGYLLLKQVLVIVSASH